MKIKSFKLSAFLLITLCLATFSSLFLSASPKSAQEIEASAGYKKVITTLNCACGNCVRTTLKTCTCSFAVEKREFLINQFKAGKTADQIIDEYLEKYGAKNLANPPKEGFFKVGYQLPVVGFIALVVGIGLFFIWRQKKSKPKAIEPSTNELNADLKSLEKNPKLKKFLEDDN